MELKKWQYKCHLLILLISVSILGPIRPKPTVTKLTDIFTKQSTWKLRNSYDSSIIITWWFSLICLLILSSGGHCTHHFIYGVSRWSGSSVRMVSQLLCSSSCTFVWPFLNIRQHCVTSPSFIPLFLYTVQFLMNELVCSSCL